MSRTKMSQAKISRAKMSRAKMSRAKMSRAKMSRAQTSWVSILQTVSRAKMCVRKNFKCCSYRFLPLLLNLMDSNSHSTAKMEVDSPVRAHVRRQDGRLQAYGWSLPSRPPGSASSAASSATSSSSAAAAGAGAPAPASTASPAAKGHAVSRRIDCTLMC